MDIAANVLNAPSPVIAIHQPNFAPWAGYFHKMLMVDTFVYLDNVPYSKNSFQNRNRILINGHSQWLTVPVCSHGMYGEPTKDILINDQTNWRRKHVMTLKQNYGKATGFDWAMERLMPVYQTDYIYLYKFNMAINQAIRWMLEIQVPVRMASELTETQGPTDRLVAIVTALGGRTYLSGPSGRKYIDLRLFDEQGINIRYQEFRLRPYAQQQEVFVPGLSILDLLFNLGPEAAGWLRGGGL
ncbi:WbqC family protein [bacterium]|nr:WbqC family protein [candidate division CSSED10-310 bacterium]